MLQEASQSPDVLSASIPASKTQYETPCKVHRFIIYIPKQDTSMEVLAGWYLYSFLSPSSPSKLLTAQMKFPAILINWTLRNSAQNENWKLTTLPNLGTSRGGLFKSIVLKQNLLSVVVTQSPPPYVPILSPISPEESKKRCSCSYVP